MSVTTATVELVRAGLIDPANIPWTVSLHDLELITELVDRPAEFLLYLRRRRDPLTTHVYMAPDELDLFLLYFEGNLWAEPDPDEVYKTFPFTGPSTSAARRRFREQGRAYITSRTDQLDEWHYSKSRTGGPTAPKPHMFHSPAGQLIDELMERGVFGALSLGATLLSGSTAFQEQIADMEPVVVKGAWGQAPPGRGDPAAPVSLGRGWDRGRVVATRVRLIFAGWVPQDGAFGRGVSACLAASVAAVADGPLLIAISRVTPRLP